MANTNALKMNSDSSGAAFLDIPTLGSDQHFVLSTTGGNFLVDTASTRVAVSDTSPTITGTHDQTIAYTSISTARAPILPAASGKAGQRITVIDESGSCSVTNIITVTAAGSDTIDGQASVPLSRPYVSREFISNGTNAWTMVGSVLRARQITSDTSWTAPAGVYRVFLTLAGGGGGGAGSTATTAGSGGAGGLVVQRDVAVTPGTSYSITIGAAGTAGASGGGSGGNGGSTAFGSLLTALGGTGGYTSGNTLLTGSWYASYSAMYQGMAIYHVTNVAATYMGPQGSGGNCGQASSASPGGQGGPQIGAGGAAGTTANTLPGGGGGGGSVGEGGAGGAGKTGGTAGTSASANTGGGGGGAGAGGNLAGGAGGSGVCYILWVE